MNYINKTVWILSLVSFFTDTASGVCAGLQSVCTMLASSLTGLLWFRFGAAAA